ncbi:CBS domain-containing protein [Kribbella sp. NBC_00709]|uniref:CBS domain-containing protein n=1 Tax=Kribbella sp. NBC_00709 TaxID=2975972 RepID=UPI002E2ACC02|nr:CBS domain-containing protein [Kribbella sp. NBC_00709]
MLIREVMTTPAATLTTASSTAAALQLMQQEQARSLPVVDRRGTLIGIVCQADLVRNRGPAGDRTSLPSGRVPGTTLSDQVGAVMTHHIVSVGPDEEIQVAVDLMQSMVLEEVPVVENDRVVGTVYRSDLIRLLLGPSRTFGLEASAGTPPSKRPADADLVTPPS